MASSGRSIIQLCAIKGFNKSYLFALCDDSTVWKLDINTWIFMPSIPQDDPE